MTGTVYEVGASFPTPELTAQPGAGWHPSAGLILLCDTDITADDVARFADMRLYLAAVGPVIGLLLDASSGRVELPSMRLTTDEPAFTGAGCRAVFDLVLVNHTSQLVVGMRTFTVSPHFTTALRRKVKDRWTEPLPTSEVDAAVDAWYRRLPDAKAVRANAIASSRSGG